MKKMIVIITIFVQIFFVYAATETIDGVQWCFVGSEIKNVSSNYRPAIPESTSGKIVIPSVLGGSVITSLGRYSFYRCSNITDAIIPNSITNIDEYAFSGCKSLNSIVIHTNVTRIGKYAFSETGLTNAVILTKELIPNASNYLFSRCTNLVGVTTLVLESDMFYGCDRLQDVTLLEGIRKIRSRSLSGLLKLKTVIVPNSVMHVEPHAFSDSKGLECVKFKNPNTRIASSDGSVIINDDYSFDGCDSIVDVTIPQHACTLTLAKTFPDSYQSITNIVVLDGVTRIGAECFKNCFGVKRIVIPASVTAIYDNAFKDCSELEEIVFLGDAPDVGSDILLGTPRSLKITVKEGSVGWKGGVSTELPEAWPVGDATARGITYSGINDRPEGGGSSGGESAVVDTRYDLADDVADRAIANVEIDGDTAIDSFVLKDGKVYDSVVRIVNTSASAAKISLPGGFIYEKFKGTKPLEIPTTSTNLLTITRTKGNTFLLSREELVLEVQE